MDRCSRSGRCIVVLLHLALLHPAGATSGQVSPSLGPCGLQACIKVSGEGEGLVWTKCQRTSAAQDASTNISHFEAGWVLQPMNEALTASWPPSCQAALSFIGVSSCCAPGLIPSLLGTRCPEVRRWGQVHSSMQLNTLHMLSSTGQGIQQLCTVSASKGSDSLLVGSEVAPGAACCVLWCSEYEHWDSSSALKLS